MQNPTYKDSDYDMRQELSFPDPPESKADIWNFRYRGYLIACAMVGRYDYRQYNVYRMLWQRMDDDSYRRTLERVRSVLAGKNTLLSPAAFLAAELKKELD